MMQEKSQYNRLRAARSNLPTGRKVLGRIAAGLAVLYTVQALGMPVFASDSKAPLCGLDHAHETSCYAIAEVPENTPDLTGKVLHSHNKYCYDSASCLICPMPELKEHLHTDSCYEIKTQETVPALPPHVHCDECYTMVQGEQICTAEELPAHIHTDACYETVKQETPPEEAHTHTDSCYSKQQGNLTCALPESAGHAHGSDCYVRGDALICDTEEGEAHAHENSCYEKRLACQMPEDPGHAHADTCYEWTEILSCGAEETPAPEKVLICTQSEQPAHAHSDACFQWTKELVCAAEELPPESTEPAEPVKVLTCSKFEFKNHIHADGCYETDSSGVTTLICTRIQLESHQHTQNCLGLSADALLCEREESDEHSHSYCCYGSWSFLCQLPDEPAEEPTEPTEEPTEPVEELPTEPKSDPTADIEYPSDWEKTVAHVQLTGVWSQDLLNIAQSQLGYRESKRNFTIYRNGDQKGYTRYGQWYGFPYGDWCAMFASFCLNYAEIKDVPLDCNCAHWITTLTESGMYAESDVYTPKPGDLVFFDHGRVSATAPRVSYGADHVAIVAEVIPATQTESAKLVTIEGNHYNRVCYETHELNSTTIIGYGLLPDGPSAIYSCGLPTHTHDDICYDEGENIACRTQAHTHDSLCRSRSLQFADDTVRVDVTLSNAVAVPENLQLSILPLSGGVDPSSATEYAPVFRIALTVDSQPYRLPAGVQAEVQIRLTESMLTNGAQSQIQILAAAPQRAQNSSAAVWTTQIPDTDHASAVHFFTNRLCDFTVVPSTAAQE